jgi:hypothetical protein
MVFVYPTERAKMSSFGAELRGNSGGLEMSDAKDVIRVAGMILLGIFVVAVGVPLVLAAAGFTLGVLGFLFGVAVALIKVAVVLAIGYLILVGVRAMLR